VIQIYKCDVMLTISAFKYCVRADGELKDHLEQIKANFNQDESLLAVTRLAKVFKDDEPQDEHLHIVAKLPFAGVCVALVILNKANFDLPFNSVRVFRTGLICFIR
jgi:hypothetical protein